MNHFIVRVFGVLNGAIAIFIFAIAALMGHAANPDGNGLMLGALIGALLAVTLCGIFAILISIEKSLKHIADKLPEPEKPLTLR